MKPDTFEPSGGNVANSRIDPMPTSARIVGSLAVVTLLWAGGRVADAQSTTYPVLNTGSTVAWNTTDWTLGGQPPQTATQVGLTQGGGTLSIDASSTATTPGGLLIGWGNPASNNDFSVTMSGGSLTVGTRENFGLSVGEHGIGVFTQSGGTVVAPTVKLGRDRSGTSPTFDFGNGTYTLSGGILEAATISVGTYAQNTGTLNLNGGTLRASASGTLLAAKVATEIQAGNATIDTQGFDATIASAMTGAGSLAKSGAGSLVLAAANSYAGGTSITAGRLELAAGGQLSASGTITIDGVGAELRSNSATTLTAPLTLTRGTISGTGTIGTAVNVGANAVLSPGNSPGEQAYTSGLTWSPGGTYQWEINDAAGVAGTNWDLLRVSGGALDLSGLSGESRFNLDLTTLTGSAGGPMANYVDGQAYTFSLATYASLDLPTGFSGNDLTSLFDPSFANWQNPAPLLANVSIVNDADAGMINLVIVPEPGPVLLLAGGAAVAAVAWSRRRTGALGRRGSEPAF